MKATNKRAQKQTGLKIFITGDPGAGKSTTAIALQKMLNIPVFHADAYRLKDPSTFNPYNEFKDKINKILKENNNYIIDGCNFGNDLGLIKKIMADVDVILNFDFPTTLALSNWIKRTEGFMKGATHEGTSIGKGYTYGSPKDFKFFLEYYAGYIEEREKRKAVFNNTTQNKVINLRNFSDINKLLGMLGNQQNPGGILLNLLASDMF